MVIVADCEQWFEYRGCYCQIIVVAASPDYMRKYQGDVVGVSHNTGRVPTSSGNHGKPGKSPKKVPCMEKSWNLKKPE